MTDEEIEMPDRIFATCENHECEWSDERYRHWNHQVEYVRVDLSPPVASQAALRAALNRQCDNMAFVINHMTIPAQYYEKFIRELEEDRAALAAEVAAE